LHYSRYVDRIGCISGDEGPPGLKIRLADVLATRDALLREWRGRVALPRDRRCASASRCSPFCLFLSFLCACSRPMDARRRTRGSASLPAPAKRLGPIISTVHQRFNSNQKRKQLTTLSAGAGIQMRTLMQLTHVK